MDNMSWPPFKKKTVSIGLMSAKRVIVNNWKTTININEKVWLKTFETLLSLEQMSNSIESPTPDILKRIMSHVYKNISVSH